MKTAQLLSGAVGALLALLAQPGYAQGNYFAGLNAGSSNTTGTLNTFVGALAGDNNTTGFGNSFFGFASGVLNVSSTKNTFLGTYSGYFNNSNLGENTFVGYRSGFSTNTGFYNSFLGSNAGAQNTSGSYNVFVGSGTGDANTTGLSNTFVGWAAGSGNTTANANAFFGNLAGYNNSTGAENAVFGSGAAIQNTTGSRNTTVGTLAGRNNTTGNNNTFLGYSAESPAGVALTNATAIGHRSYVSASNALVLGSINGVNGATANARVGIGLSAPTHQLRLSLDDAAKPGSADWTVVSDERLKKNVEAYTDGLELVKQIEPVWYQYTGEAGLPTNQTFVGVLAQRMQKIAPYTVGRFTYQEDANSRPIEYLDYNAGALTYALVNAVKEQQRQIEQQEAAIGEMKTQNENVRGELEKVRLESENVRGELGGIKTENETVRGELEGIKAENENIRRELAEIKALLTEGKASGARKANDDPTEGVVDDAAQLWQNQPNPTDGSTVIRYRIPKAAGRAQLKLFSTTGQELHTFELTERGSGQVTVPAKLLPAGTYLYRLLVDGQSRQARKLVQLR
ncbi:MAG: tail fiber domain-containing protein [Ferruginibacter sp.]|nr:tail fiber domain-containing protein [Cytophagales bacterium]